MLMTMAAASLAAAADLDMILAAPQSPVRGGARVELTLFLYNNTDAAINRELPPSVPCRIFTGQKPVKASAALVNPRINSLVRIPGRGFAKREYALSLPVFAVGAVRIELERIGTPPLIIDVQKAPPEAWVGQQVPLDEGPTLLQSYIKDLSVYEPMYFLLSAHPELEQSKFQFSFKYRLFNSNGYLEKRAPWLAGFHLAYTQRSIWDLKHDSVPFKDTSYMPELFYLLPKIDLHMKAVSAFGIQSGFQHESNGKGGADSRSANYLYIEPILGVHLAGPYHLKVAPKIYAYVSKENNNADLQDYRGYVDLETGIIDPDGLALSSHLWWAKKGATVQLDLTYPMSRLLGRDLNFYLQAQYFSGYAETLRYYNQRNDVFRLGLAIVR
jgi:outer membrane phospholipase A